MRYDFPTFACATARSLLTQYKLYQMGLNSGRAGSVLYDAHFIIGENRELVKNTYKRLTANNLQNNF